MNLKLVNTLNALVLAERTAMHQYLTQKHVALREGLPKLAKHYHQEAHEERVHLNRLLERIEFLGGTPTNMATPLPGWVHIEDPIAMMEHDLDAEKQAVEDYRHAVDTAISEGDYDTEKRLRKTLREEHESVEWISRQQKAMKRVGEQNWLNSWR